MRMLVTTSVIHPPTKNFSMTTTTRMVRHKARPMTWMGRCFHQSWCSLRCVTQKRAIPRFDSEKVTKTLIEYMTTSFEMSPCV